MMTATTGTNLCKKVYLYFTFECRSCVNLFSRPIGLKTCSGQTCTNAFNSKSSLRKQPSFFAPGPSSAKKIQKFSHCDSRSSKYVEVIHFTLLFCRGWQRNVPRFKTHVHNGFAKAPSTLIRFQTKTELFCSGYSYRPHYNAQNDHRKRSHSKNGGQTLPCGFSLDRRCSVDGRKRCKKR